MKVFEDELVFGLQELGNSRDVRNVLIPALSYFSFLPVGERGERGERVHGVLQSQGADISPLGIGICLDKRRRLRGEGLYDWGA